MAVSLSFEPSRPRHELASSRLLLAACAFFAAQAWPAAAARAECRPPDRRDTGSLLKAAEADATLARAQQETINTCLGLGHSPYDQVDTPQRCKVARAACLRAHEVHTTGVALHENAPFLADIEGGWGGVPVSWPIDPELSADIDGTIDCSASIEGLKAQVENRVRIGVRHRRLRDEWERWYGWALQQAQACSTQPTGAAGPAPVTTPTPTTSPEQTERDRRWEEYQAYLARQQQRAEDADRFNREMEGIARNAALSGPEGGNGASGRSWRFHLSTGAGFPWLPVLADKESVSCASPFPSFCQGRMPESSREGGGGVGVSLELAFDPVFAPHYGFGFHGGGMVGGLAGPGMSAFSVAGGVGAQAFAGSDASIAVVADVGTSWRHARYASDFEFYDPLSGSSYSDETIGRASYRADRFGGGLRLCLAKQEGDRRFCKSYLQALVAREMTPSGDAMVYRLEMMGRGMFSVSADLAFDYPAAGTASHAVDSREGLFFIAHVAKSFDVFGKPRTSRRVTDPTSSAPADFDQDGIEDASDTCPESADADPQRDGCPDRDGDRVLDWADACPDQAAVQNRVADEDGCPEPSDSDGDGLSDPVDQCPAEAEDRDMFEDADGCPEADNDRDGVPDVHDKCTNEAGAANDGCPPSYAFHAMADGTLAATQVVRFADGETTMATGVEAFLDEVARVMKDHSELELRIIGFAKPGAPGAADLSVARAAAVQAALLARGVAAERLLLSGIADAAFGNQARLLYRRSPR